MDNRKVYTSLFILLLLIIFCITEYIRLSTKVVLKILEPTMIQVDMNGNRKIDDNETICIPEITTLTSNIKNDYSEFAFNNNVNSRDIIALGYMSEDFATDFLLNKSVDLKFTGEKNSKCRFADVIINDTNYKELLILNGYAIKNNSPVNKLEFDNKLSEARKLDIVILNHKSNKYHSPDCKYAKAARDSVAVLRKQLSAKSVPCKMCLADNNTHQIQSNIKSVPTIISNGNIELYLTDFTSKLKPDIDCLSNVCKLLVKHISESDSSIDIAAYGWESIPVLEKALNDAKLRGVKIRVVADEKIPDDKYYPDRDRIISLADDYMTDLNPYNRQLTNYLMHNKFIIIDNKLVITGSTNFSATGLSGFNANNMILINSDVVANIYTSEFEQMFSGTFHNKKITSNSNNCIHIDSAKLSVFFSPQDKTIVSQIIPLIESSKKYIYIPTFVFTHKQLSDAIISAKRRGVDVKIIIDATNSNQIHTKHYILRKSGIPVKMENFPGKMHMKTMIIDDKYTIIGSMNFSNSGENKNDENTIIMDDVRIAKFYRDYFNFLWAKIPDTFLYNSIKPEGKDTPGSCNDTVDNDHDGKIDYLDSDCK